MDASELHDRLLANQAAGVEHDAKTCALCLIQGSDRSKRGPDANHGGATVTEAKAITQDDVQAAVDKAVAEATAPLQTELDAFRADAGTAEIETQLAEAKAPLETKITELQAELDAKVLEATASAAELDELKTFLDDAAATAEAAAEVASKVETRKTEVAAVASFPEEYVTANAERWAAMDDAGFATYLEDLKIVAAKSNGARVPTGTALTASREGAGSTNGTVAAGLAAVRELRENGHDPRTL